MRPTFLPRLVNDPVDDPAVFIPFLLQQRAILFDLGDISALTARDVLKISHVFVTHAHIDHFFGFDRLVRLMLGREKILHIFGPSGFIERVAGKLAGYTWDLVHRYASHLTIAATEVQQQQMVIQQFSSRHHFRPQQPETIRPFDGILVKEPGLTVSAAVLDHSTPCLGFRLAERFHINICKDKLAARDLAPGPWLADFKHKLYESRQTGAPATVDAVCRQGGIQRYPLDELAEAICLITPGQVVAYISDAVLSPDNEPKMIDLARNADHLFIEATFLEKDLSLAVSKNHLTARQAGAIAGRAGVKQLIPFHFSPRYSGHTQLLEVEALEAFRCASRS